MLVLASHAFALVALTVAASWDLMTTEVPDPISVAIILVGVASHGILSYLTGSLEPIIWSVGVGAVFSIYGWGMYFSGSWGGADAFAISALGFAAPYSFAGPGFFHPVDLFINIMLLGFLYAIGFAFYRAIRTDGIFHDALNRLKEDELRVATEIIAAAVVSIGLGTFLVLDPIFYFVSFLFIILLYRFLVSVEDKLMTKTVDASEVQIGDVVVKGGEDALIKGVTEEQIEKLSGEVTIKTGIKFVPVFPIALFLTDLGLLGIEFLFMLFS